MLVEESDILLHDVREELCAQSGDCRVCSNGKKDANKDVACPQYHEMPLTRTAHSLLTNVVPDHQSPYIHQIAAYLARVMFGRP